MLWLDRARVMLRTLSCGAAWSFRPRQSLALIRYLQSTRPTWREGVAELNAYSPPVGGKSFPRYLAGLRCLSKGEPVPLIAHVSVTDRCGYSCARCSNLSRAVQDPPVENLQRLFEGLGRAGTSRIALTGGEPCLREDLAEIVKASSPDLSPLLFTSGQGLGAGRARELRRAGLTAAFVSLDHFLPEEHDRIRGPGAFQEALEALKACREAGIYTAAQAVVEAPLLRDGGLDRYLGFCRGLGIDEVMFLDPIPVAGASPVNLLDDGARMELSRLHRRAARDPSLPKVSTMSFLEGPDLLGCQAGFSFLHVTAEGEVLPCDFVPISFGNFFELGLDPILERIRRTLKGPSRRCLALGVRTQLQGSAAVRGDAFPVLWNEAQGILAGYDPGEPPGLMRHLATVARPSAEVRGKVQP